MKCIKPLTLLLVCALSFSLTAKADGNGNANGHNKQKEGKKVPIDGGITLLVVAGAALGAKKIFSKSTKSVLNDDI